MENGSFDFRRARSCLTAAAAAASEKKNSRFSHRRMFPTTSPLIEAAQVTGVLVRSTEEWHQFGESAWADMMAALQLADPTRRVMGIDSEWFYKNPLATVQVATATHCVVIHLSYLDNRILPAAVKQAFEDPSIIKCGVGVSGDVKRLQSEQGLHMTSVMDLGNYATLMELAQFGKTSLNALAKHVCGLDMEKNHMITRSNWELPLSAAQFSYAADDAVASFLVGDRIMREAVQVYSLSSSSFHPALWLSQTQEKAAHALKAILREKQRKNSQKQQQEVTTAAAAAATQGGGGTGVPVIPQSTMRVRVLSKDGDFLFECSLARAKFYLEDKGIATMTKSRPENPRKPQEIQLKFENQKRTRLCMYHAVGQCDLGEHCPFAHGVDQLCEESQQLRKDPTALTCAFCIGPKHLMRHAIVPPSFRKFLPKPVRIPVDTEDFVPICTQCNTQIRHYYDFLMNTIYREAEEADPMDKVKMEQVANSVKYSRLLLDKRKLAEVPEERQEQLKQYILRNWVATRMFDKRESEEAATTNGGAEEGCDGEQAPKQTMPPTSHEVEETEAARPVGTGSGRGAGVGEDGKGAGDTFDEDWENLEGDDVAATCVALDSGGDAHGTTTRQRSFPYKNFVDRNGEKLPVRDPKTGDINLAFVERLSHVVPGEVRARVTMQTLVGTDVDKAVAFVERWRNFCLDSCGMIDKPSNHLTGSQWEVLSAANSRPSRGRPQRHQQEWQDDSTQPS